MYLWFLSSSYHIQLAAYLVKFLLVYLATFALPHRCDLDSYFHVLSRLLLWPLHCSFPLTSSRSDIWRNFNTDLMKSLKKKKLDTTVSCFKFPVACCCSGKRFKFFVRGARFVPNWPHLVLQPQLFPVFTYVLDGQATQDCPLLLKSGTTFHDSALLPYYPLCLGCSYFLSIFQVQFPMPIPFQISSSSSS